MLVPVACALVVLVAGCVPSNRGEAREVDDNGAADPPAIEVGDELDRDALVAALAVDLADRPDDLDFWVPTQSEAACASERIVDGIGSDRLWGLGYRPATDGSSLAALELSGDERPIVVAAFVECVDQNEAIAQILFGGGRMPASVATCMADGLESVGQLEPFVAAAALGGPVDPFANDAALATALSTQAAICIPEDAFDWPDLRLPGRNPILDATSEGGTTGSRFEDDQTTTTETPS